MSFIKNLGKSFVRSAVNQVGRDGGKVISNRIYGGKHSTPIRVSQNSKMSQQTEDAAPEIHYENQADLRYGLQEQGYRKEGIILNWFMWLMVLLNMTIPYVCGLIVLMGVVDLFINKLKFYKFVDEPVYKEDKRYKEGRRLDGYKQVKEYYSESVPMNKEEKTLKNIQATVLLGLGLFSFYLQESILNYQAYPWF